jgi:hypothetical protein
MSRSSLDDSLVFRWTSMGVERMKLSKNSLRKDYFLLRLSISRDSMVEDLLPSSGI